MTSKIGCDIVIPVYNALEDLRECVGSVIANTSGNFRLVLIDDKSPEPGISAYLAELEGRSLPNIVIKRNDVNLGFVKTVNRGMREGGSDVVLLNSDTVVSRGWLGRLTECAYSDETIASVTPLTNSGTICSVPRFCEDNPLPNGFTPQAMADLVERVSMRSYPRIPTGVGFCMYIKRCVLDEIGYFDEETFGRGYGEENDWCCRAREAGYSHALDDATFIYHKGAMSFKGAKARLIENNLKLLINKYPYYFEMIDRFIAGNPLWDVQENLRFHIGISAVLRPRVLLAMGSGGAETHRRIFESLFTDKIYKEAALYLLHVEKGSTLVLRDLALGGWPGKESRIALRHPVEFPSYAHKDYGESLGKVINTFGIDALIILGLEGHSLEVFRAAKREGMPVRVAEGLQDAWPDDAALRKASGDPTNLMKKWCAQLASCLEGVDAIEGTPRALTDGLAPTARRGEGAVFSWPEIKAAMVSGGTEAIAVEKGYTEKQKEAFNYLLSFANRHQKSLTLAKALYRLLKGKGADR